MSDDGGLDLSSVILLAAAGAVVYVIAKPAEAGAAPNPVQAVGGSIWDALSRLFPGASSPSSPIGPGVTIAPAPSGIPGAVIVQPPGAVTPPVLTAPGAVTVTTPPGAGATAGMSDLAFAAFVSNATVSTIKAGGQLIQMAGIANVATFLQIVGTVGLVVDMAFTAMDPNKSDPQKAIDLALDAAMIVCLWIPVYGWIVAIVIAIVKAIFDLFAGDLFGSKQTKLARELAERARYGRELAPMLADLGHAYSPRSMARVLADWYHGPHSVSMAVGFYDVNTPGQLLVFAAPGDPSNSAGLPGMPYSWDDLATYLVWGPSDKLWAAAQVGIPQDMQAIFEDGVLTAIEKKRPTWQRLMQEGASLDALDVLENELQLEPDLQSLAEFYGYADWKALMAPMIQPQWSAYVAAHPNDGSVKQFAQVNGYADLRAWRALLFAPLWPRFLHWRQVMEGSQAATTRADALEAAAAYAISYGPPVVDAP